MVYNKKKTLLLFIVIYSALVHMAWPRGAVGSASDSRARGPGSIPSPAIYLRFRFR